MCNFERACQLFQGGVEDVDHFFRRCPTVLQIWQALLSIEELHMQQTLSFGEWIKHNTCESIHCDINSKWDSLCYNYLVDVALEK